MVVANDVSTDSRVQKEANALAEAGHDVIVLGTSTTGQEYGSTIGAVPVVHVPVQRLISGEMLRSRARRRQRALLGLPYLDRESAAAAAARAKLRRTELEERGDGAPARGRVSELLSLTVRAQSATRVVRLRRAMTLRARGLWRSWDRAAGRSALGARWWRVHPLVDDYELAFGRRLDQLAPDVIHAHDMHVIGVAARAAARGRRDGRRLRWVYDAHEFVPGLSQYGHRTRRMVTAWADLERRYIGRADRLVTVSAPIADELVHRYALSRRPTVVLNVPDVPDDSGRRPVPGVRRLSGVAPDDLLLVYAGGISAARGLDVAVAALQHVPEAHLCIVCVPSTRTDDAVRLHELSRRLGVEDRLHLVEPVDPGAVVDFLASADIGLVPIRRYRSHELALPNKLFEYTLAGLPVVVSRLDAMSRFVRETGVGTTHVVDDPRDLARAIGVVQRELRHYRVRARSQRLRSEYSWARQAERLTALYEDLAVDLSTEDAVVPET